MQGVKGIEYGKRIYPRISDDMYNLLQELAWEKRLTMSELVRDIITEYLTELKRKEKQKDD